MSTDKKIHAIDPDFYCANAYEESHKRGIHHIIIKVFSIVFLIGIVLWAYKYMSSNDTFVSEMFTAHNTSVQKEDPLEKAKSENEVLEHKVASTKNVNLSNSDALNPEEIAQIVQNVLVQLNATEKKSMEIQNNIPIDDRIYLKKNANKRLNSDELSREYVDSVRNALGK
ncbi:hypothetical protein KKC13_01005 [bacterium]|nr:hypothetical protein [bacterium]MBU1958837.1 hypothetical protein [bacterium]